VAALVTSEVRTPGQHLSATPLHLTASMPHMTAESSLTTSAVCAASLLPSSGLTTCTVAKALGTAGTRHAPLTQECSAHLQGQVVLEGVCAADGVAQARAAHSHPAAVLCRVPHGHGVLREAGEAQACQHTPGWRPPCLLCATSTAELTVKVCAQRGAHVLKLAVSAPADHHVCRGVQRGKVALERNVPWGHGDARPHALKGAPPTVVPAACVTVSACIAWWGSQQATTHLLGS
jgi:hypothetical protein